MNILCRLTVRNLCRNTKRTLVTIVGIALATALITAVGNLAESFRASMIVYEKEHSGSFHYCFAGVKPENLKFFENNANLEKTAIAEEVGYALLADSANPQKPYIYIRAMDEACREITAMRLRGGRWPENENEIVIVAHMRSNGGSRLTMGDSVTLTMGARETDSGEALRQNRTYLGGEERFVPTGERTYTVVGIMERPVSLVEGWEAPGYTAVTCPGERRAEWSVVYAAYTKTGIRNRAAVTEGLAALANSCSSNSSMLRWETMRFSGRTMRMIYGMAAIAVAIIMVTSVFCIRNSFQISLTEKMRLYGMLASVGTTAKQRRRLVYYEAFFLGSIGIPIGACGGILATLVLVKGCGGLMRYIVDTELVYEFSLPAVLVGGALAAATVFLSALRSAVRASRLSPISAIRGSETIRRGRGGLRVPGIIDGLFGIGGALAYKNLRRSRVKYRTTVISIVVSVTVFIAMTTFIDLGFHSMQGEYQGGGYSLMVTLMDEERAEQVKMICAMEEVRAFSAVRRISMGVPAAQIAFTPEGEEANRQGWNTGMYDEESGACHVRICAMGEEAYAGYCGEVGVSPEEAADGAIVYARLQTAWSDEGGRKYLREGVIADFKAGSALDLLPEENEHSIPLRVVCQTDAQPDFMRGQDNSIITCFVSDAWMDANLADYLDGVPQTNLYLKCADADALEIRIRDEAPLYSYYISNYESSRRELRSMWLLIAIFFYGFITVIALIGVTNIFNTITTNMELRAREFAMLRSVGMTGREFRRMIQLESVFYGGQSLCIGIPLGCLLSRLFYIAYGASVDMPFALPVSGIAISTGAVALLLFAIMRYSMGKINRKNIIETIQNENI